MKKILSMIALVATLVLGTQAMAEIAATTVEGATTVDTAAAEKLFNDTSVFFIDPRKEPDFNRGHIPGAIHLDLKGKSTELSEATLLEAVGDKSAKIVMYCNGEKCLRSEQACEKAVGWGFTNVYFYRDGFPAWEAAGLPVE